MSLRGCQDLEDVDLAEVQVQVVEVKGQWECRDGEFEGCWRAQMWCGQGSWDDGVSGVVEFSGWLGFMGDDGLEMVWGLGCRDAGVLGMVESKGW